jgi:hypothetical protein
MIIGLVGYAGAGKDTAYALMKPQLQNYKNFKFAGKLKEFCSNMYDMPPQTFEVYEEKMKDFSFIISVEEYHKRFKELCCEVLNICDMPHLSSISLMELCSKIENGMVSIETTPRKILQIIGTNVFRDYYSETVWIDFLEEGDYVVTDVRFLNEAEKIKELGGVLVRVQNKNQPHSSFLHESEKYIEEIKCDSVIYNDGESLESFDLALKNSLRDLNIL